MRRRGVEVLAVGMVTPVGRTAPASAAAVRAGIMRLRETPLQDMRFRPFKAGFLDAEYLEPLPPSAVAGLEFSYRELRMLGLAVPALREVAPECERPPALLLALPESLATPSHAGDVFLQSLVIGSGVALDLDRSRCFPQGRAAGLLALHEAVKLLTGGHVTDVLVGGVDSFVDPQVLAELEGEERVAGPSPSDTLVPGEGAAFLWLASAGMGRRRRRTPLAEVVGVGTGKEPGHRYSQEPYRGEGLASAFHALFARAPEGLPPVQCVYAGLNGESFWAKEWGVAFLRTRERFVEGARIEHPVENFGDPGAALGPVMLGLAATGLRRGYRVGPCLVWCSSDREDRGAALLQAVPGED